MSKFEETVEMFKAMTSADDAFALTFLEANGWDLEQACSSFFDAGTQNSQASSSGSQGISQNAHGHHSVPSYTDQMDSSDKNSPGIAVGEQDNSTNFGDDEFVRAPIAQTTGRLFEEGFHDAQMSQDTNAHRSFRNFEQEARILEARVGTGSSRNQSLMNNRYDESFISSTTDVGHNDEISSATLPSNRSRNLHALFRPPQKLLFPGTLDAARTHARKSNHWILVNIQEDSEFFSYVLNRDLWSAEIVQDVLTENFIFFQRDHNDPEAQTYSRYYKPTSFPHIAVIDPLTGEQLCILDLKTRANESDPLNLLSSFLEKISKFQHSHTLSTTSNDNSSTSQSITSPPTKTSEKSLLNGEGEAIDNSSDSKAISFKHLEYELLENEPDLSHPGMTQVRVRLFNGEIVNRRFLKAQRVSQIKALVHSLVPETETRSFDILVGLPPRPLDKLDHRTLEEENLQRQTMSVKWS